MSRPLCFTLVNYLFINELMSFENDAANRKTKTNALDYVSFWP